MKNGKKDIIGSLLSELGELAIAVFFFGVGALILGLFGVKVDFIKIDFEWIILIGIGAFLVVFAVVFLLVRLVKKLLKSKRK